MQKLRIVLVLTAVCAYYALFIFTFGSGIEYIDAISFVSLLLVFGFLCFCASNVSLIAFSRIQIWNIVAVLASFLYVGFPFIRTDSVSLPDENFRILRWPPLIVMFVFTCLYYAVVSVLNKRSTLAFLDQAYFYLLYTLALGCIVIHGQLSEVPFFTSSDWVSFPNIEFQLYQMASIIIGSILGSFISALRSNQRPG